MCTRFRAFEFGPGSGRLQEVNVDSSKKYKKDYYGGALMILIGLGAINGALSYNIGTAAHMGPGFFPAALGAVLVFVGAVIAMGAKKNVPTEAPIGHSSAIPDLRGAFCIIVSIIAFFFLGEYGGLLPATFAIVFISALGDRTNTLLQAFLLAAAMTIIAVVVFWWALQLQLPLFRWG
jgi:putative Ca2+/H+ antiporter (TMEM165/GDT1 family)